MTDLRPDQILFQMLTGAWVTKSLAVVTELRVPDLLKNGPQNVSQLALASGTQEEYLYRVLRMLAGVGAFTELPNRSFALTPITEMLVEGAPHGMRNMVLALAFGEHWNAWTKLIDVVRHGGIAIDLAEGCDIWEYFRQHPDRATIFDAAMTDFTMQSNATITQCFEFGQYKRVCDVGGGHGALVVSILEAHPGVEGMVFDQEYVAEGARKLFAEKRLSGRATAIGGSFFESIAEGADIYTAKNIIHDWDDEKSLTILKNIRKVIPASGRLLLLELMVGPANIPDPGKFMDVNMMAMTGGRERTAEQFSVLFEASGFTLGRVIPTQSPVFIVEGVPA